MARRLWRSRWHWLVILLAAAAAVVAHVLFAPRPTEQIERLIQRGAEAAEAESVLRLSGVFAADYHDASGMDRAMLLGQAQRFFAETDELSVRIARVIHGDPDLADSAVEASAIVVLQVSGITNGERFVGITRTGGDAFQVGFRKRDGKWEVTSSRRLAGETPQELQRELEAGR